MTADIKVLILLKTLKRKAKMQPLVLMQKDGELGLNEGEMHSALF